MRYVIALLGFWLSVNLTAQESSITIPETTASNPFAGVESFEQPDFLRVEEAYQVGIDVEPGAVENGDSGGALRLFWQVAEGYYLYRHQFKFNLRDNRGQEISTTAQLPVGIQRTDEFFGDVEVYYGDLEVTLELARIPTNGELTIRSQGCADAGLCYPPRTEHFQIDFNNGTASPINLGKAVTPEPSVISDRQRQGPSLWLVLLLALVGGSILNLMPCVFPVLSLKVLGYAATPAHSRHLQSLAYAAGVVISFVLVASVLIGLQGAGQAVGWGFQLQSPGFVTALVYLFLLMGLSLSGLVLIGGSWMGIGDSLTRRSGTTGSFFTGVLATLVASPCTAPFMGTAVGFAATQPPAIALIVFACLGLGMALPMVLLSYLPHLARYLPSPGPWMDTFKQLMAFPLYATAVWLLWVVGRQTSVNYMALVLAGGVLLALGLWLWRFSGWPRLLAVMSMVAAALVFLKPGGNSSAIPAPIGDGKVSWSEAAQRQFLDNGKPVFVDVTADWCITCIANERAVLGTSDIREAFERQGVVYMVADWTNYNADIAAFLARYQRNGIPFYVLFAPDPEAQPRILPQILTKSTVLDALEQL